MTHSRLANPIIDQAPSGVAGQAGRVGQLVGEWFGPAEHRDYAVRTWDGHTDAPPGRPQFTLVLNRPEALRRMFCFPSELGLCESFLRGDFEVEGDLEAATGLAELFFTRGWSPRSAVRTLARLKSLGWRPERRERSGGFRIRGLRHSRPRDAAAVRAHYDVGNEFYQVWLDSRLQYSCGYFETGREDIEAAQTAKMEYICRKLRLKPGERLLDIGCGWGGLVQYAAERYGVEALGVTLSEAQADLAIRRIAAGGLEGRCRVETRDYRDLPGDGRFDKAVSVGMVEHVGRRKLPDYFRRVFGLLKPGGLFLNHGIVEIPARGRRSARWVTRLGWRPGRFVARYVFPDGELVNLDEVVRSAESAGFETRDVENMREHYVLTLRQWVKRLELGRERALGLVGERRYRVWRLYMAAAARGFATNRMALVQTLLSKGAALPLTRRDLYRY